jgi:hypothetical protein
LGLCRGGQLIGTNDVATGIDVRDRGLKLAIGNDPPGIIMHAHFLQRKPLQIGLSSHGDE